MRHISILVLKRHLYNTTYYSDKIQNSGTDQKSLFAIVNNIRRIGGNQVLPQHTSPDNLANDFARFFKEKIETIVDSFPSENTVPSHKLDAISEKCKIANFEEVSVQDITRLISQSPNKYCPQVDPLPTVLIKQNIDILAPILTTIVNRSTTSGAVPRAF